MVLAERFHKADERDLAYQRAQERLVELGVQERVNRLSPVFVSTRSIDENGRTPQALFCFPTDEVPLSFKRTAEGYAPTRWCRVVGAPEAFLFFSASFWSMRFDWVDIVGMAGLKDPEAAPLSHAVPRLVRIKLERGEKGMLVGRKNLLDLVSGEMVTVTVR